MTQSKISFGSVTDAQKQGPKSFQEDRFVVLPLSGSDFKGCLLGVLDGHNGKKTVEFCAEKVKDIFHLEDFESAESAVARLAEKLGEMTKKYESGSTLSFVCVLRNLQDGSTVASAAVLGDSPIIILDEVGKINLSPDHNVLSNLEERKAAEERGGMYKDGFIWNPEKMRGLSMARALGNAALGGIVSRKAEMYTVVDPRWILVASDGVFDPGHENKDELFSEATSLAEKRADAGEVMEWAMSREDGLQDNATALVWKAGGSTDK